MINGLDPHMTRLYLEGSGTAPALLYGSMRKVK